MKTLHVRKIFSHEETKSSDKISINFCTKFSVFQYGKFILILLVLFSGLFSSYAQSLDDYLKIAAENNPDLKAKFYQYKASLERAPQVSSLPDPQITFGILIEPMERYMGNQVMDISVMQMFPWFGTLSAAEDEALLMAKAKYQIFNEAKSNLFYEVKATYFSLFLLRNEISITKENLDILRTLEETAISKLKSGGSSGSMDSDTKKGMQMQNDRTTGSSEMSGMGGMNTTNPAPTKPNIRSQQMNNMNQMSGTSPMVDVLRIQIEINELENRLALFNDSIIPLELKFNTLLNRASGELINLPDSISLAQMPAKVSDLPDSIKKNNPMLLMLQKEEEAFLAKEEMNRKMGFPMIGLGLQYSIFKKRPPADLGHGLQQPQMEAKNMIMPMITVSVPLWRSKYNAAIEEARLERESVVQQKADTENKIMVSYEEAMSNIKDAERRFSLYKQQSTLTQQILDILLAGYMSSGTNFEEVLRIQQQLLDYKLRGLLAVVDQNITVGMLQRLMGR